MNKRIPLFVLLTILLSLFALPVQAHGYVVRAIPEDRSTLPRPPTRLQYWFSEGLETRFSSINLRDQTGTVLASGQVNSDNNALLELQVPGDLEDGAYIVELRPAFASDGHVVAESRVFFVGEEVGGIEGESASDEAVALEVMWRVLVISAFLLISGASLLYPLVLVPAWGSDAHEVRLPPRVMKRLNAVMGFGLALAFAGNVLALLQQSMVFFSVDMGQVISQNLWQVVQIGSRFGDVWNARMVLLAILTTMFLAGVYYRRTIPGLQRDFWTVSAWLTALLIATLSINSHAAGSLMLPWLGIAMDWLHALAVAFWVGGIAVLMMVLPAALSPYDGEAKRTALTAVMRRFSRLLVGVVLLVIVTGIYNALNWFITPADVQTTYGGALGLKLLMGALLLFVGALHHVALRPHIAVTLERWLSLGGILPLNIRLRIIDGFYALTRRVATFSTSLRLEVVLALVVLITVGLLSATPIPEPESLQTEVETPLATQTIGTTEITVSIIPGGTGVNTYDTQVSRTDGTVQDVEVWVQLVNPARDVRSDWLPAESVDRGLYVAAGDEIDEVGHWWTLIDIIEADGSTVRAVFAWDISEDANIIVFRDPTSLNLLVLLAVPLVIVWMFLPTMRRAYRKVNPSPLSLMIALGVIVLTIGSMVLLSVVVQEQERQYLATLFPLPEVVNTVPPDAESLMRGEALYTEHCILWEQEERDFQSLKNQLGILRDEALYQATVDGWRKLPACEGNLTDDQRWDIVNYVRTFEGRG